MYGTLLTLVGYVRKLEGVRSLFFATCVWMTELLQMLTYYTSSRTLWKLSYATLIITK